eukprot:197196_1
MQQIHSFTNTHPKLCEHALLYQQKTNRLFMFGGYSFKTFDRFDDFWMMDLNDMDSTFKKCIWKKNKKRKMIKDLSRFGYILYDDRIIIIFGGGNDERHWDEIYYLDLNDDNSSWKRSTVKCPKRGNYDAVLCGDNTVQIGRAH